MATLICIWDAPGSKLATWPTATFAVYIALHGHALRHTALQSYTEIYSYTALYIIQLHIAIHYTTLQHPSD